MSSGQGSRPVEGSVLFTNGDTRYEFIQDLGTGRHGELLLVVRPRTPAGAQAQVLLKCLALPALASSSEKYQRTRARLEEEVRLARYLRHPGIARVHGLFEMGHGLCVAVESVEGLSLNTLLAIAQTRGRYFSDAFVLYVAAQVAEALAYAHARTDEAGIPLGIVNRDINPDRIRLEPGGGVKLTDFGVAFSRLAGRLNTTLPRPQGEVMYAAPEALLGAVVDARADLFSLGLTLLEFSTGRHLYDPADLRIEELEARLSKEEREQVLAASVASMVTELPPSAEDAIWCAMSYRSEDVERAAAGLSVPLRDILHTLLRRNPAERFATAAELEAVLRTALARFGAYGGEEAVREVQLALVESGERLAELELPGGEGGISLPLGINLGGPDAIPTRDATPEPRPDVARFVKRNPDEVTTQPSSE
ncbi:serine/threonine protein kinase [Pyxidicoccus fallax]|uniref:non-specific serine/threonine protein kinase n=1 Tax=Pyxidicoccus fallax TaxID=394095 RepID=A0A848L5W3_9BACT|nr:serine/threonine-protein kinase [Pyxidicoccus fallax]NMO13887.1 serine/threonine protein kinase [Pyxidicoccus fallax]NPC77679.1 serine/threonine protein kinase [Pyxidicoccus fallax]